MLFSSWSITFNDSTVYVPHVVQSFKVGCVFYGQPGFILSPRNTLEVFFPLQPGSQFSESWIFLCALQRGCQFWGGGLWRIFLHTLILILALTLSTLLPLYSVRMQKADFFFFRSSTIKTQQPIVIGLLSVKSMNLQKKFISPPWPCSPPPPPPPFTQCCGYSAIFSVPLLSLAFWELFPSRDDLQERTEDGYKLSDWSSCYISSVTAVYIRMLVYFKCVFLLSLLICIADPFSSCLFDLDKKQFDYLLLQKCLSFLYILINFSVLNLQLSHKKIILESGLFYSEGWE